MNEQSQITLGAGGSTTFTGPDAMRFYQARTLESSLRLYAKIGMIPTRGVTITKMLSLASTFTGKTYKRGEALKAAHDVQSWADTMQSALPIVDERGGR